MTWPEYEFKHDGIAEWPMLHPYVVEEYALSVSNRNERIEDIRLDTYDKRPRTSDMLMPTSLGMFLSTLVSITNPKVVLEIGTFTGYATSWLLDGLAQDSVLITIEIDEELFNEFSIQDNRIFLIHGDAREKIATIDGTIDFVLIDGEKEQYEEYYEQVLPKVREGGLILFDNTLWAGMAIEPPPGIRSATATAAFNEKLCEDERVAVTFIPAWDGLTIARKL